MIVALSYTNLCIDFPDVSTCISPINYEGLHRGIKSSTVWFDSLNILYSFQVTTLRNLIEKEVCLWIVFMCLCLIFCLLITCNESVYWFNNKQ